MSLADLRERVHAEIAFLGNLVSPRCHDPGDEDPGTDQERFRFVCERQALKHEAPLLPQGWQPMNLHRLEGEPQTMARVQKMCQERWPHRSAIQWIESTEAGPRRHVVVTFARDRIEGAASTWLDAMDLVDAERQRRWILMELSPKFGWGCPCRT